MCGIVGLVTREEFSSLNQALFAMRHRGPDAHDEQVHQVAGRYVRLGHRRLSILDLSNEANQPFASSCGKFTIVFNGEIYNHEELRLGLSSRGYRFRTKSDTEVLLAGIEVYGLEFLRQLNGMFAFAVLDKAKRSVLLARDPFGIKPLYIQYLESGGLAFSSELQGLSAATGKRLKPDPGAISEFLLNGFLYEPRTGFLGIEKLPQGCAITLDLDSMRVTQHAYHDPLPAEGNDASFEPLLRAQLALEMEADVPVGLFFSGGIDSSVLMAGAPRKINAFFVDYGGDLSGEAIQAAAVATALNMPIQSVYHGEAEVNRQSVLDEFTSVARGTEEPISDFTFVATRIISRHAREAGFKVMLSGMGGDELFGGYPRYLAAQNWALWRKIKLPLRVASGLLRRLDSWGKRIDRLESFLGADDFAEAYTSLVGYFSFAEVARMLGSPKGCDIYLDRIRGLLEPVSHRSHLRQAMHLDRYGFLPHNLTVTDRASMAESIEVRVPFLNKALHGYAQSLPDKALLQYGKGKLPLKQFLRSRIPTGLVDRPKVGFNPPLDQRIEVLGRGLCLDLVCNGSLANYIDPDVTRIWIDDHFNTKSNHTYRIWQLIYLRMWLDSHSNRTIL